MNGGRTIWWFCGDCGRKIPHTEQTLCSFHVPRHPDRGCLICPGFWAPRRMYDPDDPATIEDWLTSSPSLEEW